VIGRYMPQWFDYAICDEAHQLANDTAQGNGLGTLAACADRTVILAGRCWEATPAMSYIGIRGFSRVFSSVCFRVGAPPHKYRGGNGLCSWADMKSE
jgi:hypothetical protein